MNISETYPTRYDFQKFDEAKSAFFFPFIIFEFGKCDLMCGLKSYNLNIEENAVEN